MDPQPPSADRPRRGRRAGAWYRRHVWPVTAVLIVVLLLAGLAAVQVAGDGRIADGVSVAGVDLGGLTTDEARAALERDLAPRIDIARFETDDGPLAVPLSRLGMRLDTRATLKLVERQGRFALPLGISLISPLGGADVPPVVRTDAVAFERALVGLGDHVATAPVDARLALSGAEVSVVPSRDGTSVDAIGLHRALVAAVTDGRAFAGPVPLKVAAPQVTTADAQARAGAAGQYLARPLTLRLRERRLVLAPVQLAAMLTVNKGDDAQDYPLTFDNPRARLTLQDLLADAETPPVDAEITVLPEGGISVSQSREGLVVDMDTLVDDLDAAASGGGLRTVFVALRSQPPALSTDDVESFGLAHAGSQFVTYFDPRNAARATNISLAAKLVDGTVVQPGAVFSLNETMGPRTTNRGFDYAPVIAADGVLRQGVGGGICQYATTLFNAAFFAGLPIVERHAHSLYISHYPIGRDATVSWGSADFKFRNDTAKPLTIRSWVEDRALTVAIVGKTDRKVTYTTSDFYDVRSPAHGKSDPRVIYDEDVAAGMVRWEKGTDGHSIKVTRTVRDETGHVLLRDTFVSTYDPMDWVKRVGSG